MSRDTSPNHRDKFNSYAQNSGVSIDNSDEENDYSDDDQDDNNEQNDNYNVFSTYWDELKSKFTGNKSKDARAREGYLNERQEILTKIREIIHKDKTLKIDKNDILDKDLLSMPISDLEMVLSNLNFQIQQKNKGFFGNTGLKILINIFYYLSGGLISMEEALKDNFLIEEFDDFLTSYIPIFPSLVKVVYKLITYTSIRSPENYQNNENNNSL
jgi:hypothetical protein